jgi:hypothetical protein
VTRAFGPLPVYRPSEGDEPLDAIELAIVDALASIIANKIRARRIADQTSSADALATPGEDQTGRIK